MQYQLVIQLPESLEGGLDKLIELEDEFDARIGNNAEIDGHDIGSGQMNIFIITSNPVETFQIIKNILTKDTLASMKAAYRNIEDKNFICLYPEKLTHFDVT